MASAPVVVRPAGDDQAPRAGVGSEAATHRQLRGSTLLLGGRMISLGLNFATQVLIVRYLSKAEFGIFAYGLAMVSLGEALTTVGLDKALSRFLPIYDERRMYGRLFGALLMAIGSVLLLGLGFILVAIGLDGFAVGSMADHPEATTVLIILICLAPLQALDTVLMGVFAVFTRPRAIFLRRYVLAPCLRLAAIIAVIALAEDLRELALFYVLAGVIGIGLYVVLLVHSFRDDGLLQRFRVRTLEIPARELLAFALPLVVVDLLFVVMNTTNVLMLQAFGSVQDVADYRVVQPAAKLNMLVMTSFALLFTPAAARLFAREDADGIGSLYWRTAAWIAVLSFPVFAMTFIAADAVTVGLFGDQYAASAPILALLSLGYYVNAAFGFNGLTLRVFGLVRLVVGLSLAAAVVNVAVNLALIPAYGAIGAGVGTCITLLAHNGFKQAALRRGTGISVIDREHLGLYASLAVVALGVGGLAYLAAPPAPVQVALALLAAAVVFAINRSALRVADTFPEVSRIPLLRRFIG